MILHFLDMNSSLSVLDMTHVMKLKASWSKSSSYVNKSLRYKDFIDAILPCLTKHWSKVSKRYLMSSIFAAVQARTGLQPSFKSKVASACVLDNALSSGEDLLDSQLPSGGVEGGRCRGRRV